MLARILVVHSVRPEALATAAGAVAEVLRRSRVVVEVRATPEVESLQEFDSVVVCGQIGASGWRDGAVDFIARFRRELAYKSVAYCIGLAPEMDARDSAAIQRALKWPMDWYNEVRPVRTGLFHLATADARAAVMRWAERLKPNFVNPSLESPSGIRSFLEAHPVERQDQSTVPTAGFTEAERRLSRGALPEGPPSEV